MFGIPKKWTDAAGRTAAGLGAAATLLGSGVPAAVKSNTNLTKELTSYSKDVRLPETKREIDRALRHGGRVNNAHRLAGTQQINTKDLKNLKKK